MEPLDLVEWHAPDLWEKLCLEQYHVSKAFHQLHKVVLREYQIHSQPPNTKQ